MVVKKKTVSRKTKAVTKKTVAKKKVIKRQSTKQPVSKKKVVLEGKMEAIMPESIQVGEEPVYHEMDSALEDNALYSWEAPEFLYHKKSTLWHVAVYSVIAAVTILMIFLKQWFSIPVFLLIAVLVFQYAEVKPKKVMVTLTSLGIMIGNKFYPFSEIKSFWVLYNPPLKQLNLELTKRFSPIISVLIDGTDPALIKELLASHVIEDDTRVEDLIDRVIRLVRF